MQPDIEFHTSIKGLSVAEKDGITTLTVEATLANMDGLATLGELMRTRVSVHAAPAYRRGRMLDDDEIAPLVCTVCDGNRVKPDSLVDASDPLVEVPESERCEHCVGSGLEPQPAESADEDDPAYEPLVDIDADADAMPFDAAAELEDGRAVTSLFLTERLAAESQVDAIPSREDEMPRA